jgi:diacylglycerol kinase (ATP)
MAPKYFTVCVSAARTTRYYTMRAAVSLSLLARRSRWQDRGEAVFKIAAKPFSIFTYSRFREPRRTPAYKPMPRPPTARPESAKAASPIRSRPAGPIEDALLIFNPASGRGKTARLKQVDRARAILSRDHIETQLVLTDGPGEAPGGATDLARKAVKDGRQLVIACGGDGTLNEVVNGLAGSQVPLALLPAGTANVLAKELGLPWHIEKAAALVARCEFRRIALGLVANQEARADTPAAGHARPAATNGSPTGAANHPRARYFLSVAGAGPDGAIVYSVHAGLKKGAGTLAYWAEGLRQLAQYDFPQFRVMAGGRTIEATLIVVGRTQNYGGPFRITTEADLYSDSFELMVCTTRSRFVYLVYLSLLCAGRLRSARHAHFLQASSVRCEPLDPASRARVQVDGESAGSLPAEFRIVPDALTLAVPPSLRDGRRS